ncbi:MAG: hypothetical protein WCN88_03190 [Candidatus Falkowbacteria bacterium]
MQKKNLIKSSVAVASLVVASMFGFSAAFGYGGGGGASYSAPAPAVTAIGVPLTIGSSQEGVATNNLGNGIVVQVAVPKGAVTGQTTFKTELGQVGENQPTGSFMVGGQVFNITATDINNNSVTSFSNNLTITLQIPGLPADVSDLGVYWFNTSTNAWVLVPGAIFNTASGKVTFSVNHLTKFAVLSSKGTPATISISPAVIKQVLGEKKYADGTLLKGTNHRIYVVKGNAIQYISTLKELAKYRGPVLKVSDEVISSFSKAAVLGAKKYANGTLVKAKGDAKIYVIKDGKKVHIKSLAELRQQKGKTLTVEASELNNY